jgi:hypothetical protein
MDSLFDSALCNGHDLWLARILHEGGHGAFVIG